MSSTSFTVRRIQYPFASLTDEQKQRIIGRNRTLAYTIQIQEQWNTFERIENYNDIVYQKYERGLRGELYYQYVSDQEFRDYRAGQQLHTIAYSNLPATTFQSIRDLPMPDVPIIETIPAYYSVPRFAVNQIIPTASEIATRQADTEVYAYVSTYNAYHVLKYTFVDDIEKNAYERAELRIIGSQTTI